MAPLKFGRIGYYQFNEKPWNKLKVKGLSGYSIKNLKEPLKALAVYLKNIMSDGRLNGIDIESINDIKDFDIDKYTDQPRWRSL